MVLFRAAKRMMYSNKGIIKLGVCGQKLERGGMRSNWKIMT